MSRIEQVVENEKYGNGAVEYDVSIFWEQSWKPIFFETLLVTKNHKNIRQGGPDKSNRMLKYKKDLASPYYYVKEMRWLK